jgi:hypothetical protein
VHQILAEVAGTAVLFCAEQVVGNLIRHDVLHSSLRQPLPSLDRVLWG